MFPNNYSITSVSAINCVRFESGKFIEDPSKSLTFLKECFDAKLEILPAFSFQTV